MNDRPFLVLFDPTAVATILEDYLAGDTDSCPTGEKLVEVLLRHLEEVPPTPAAATSAELATHPRSEP